PTLQMGTISGKLAGEQKAGLTVIAEQVLGGQAASVRYASSKKQASGVFYYTQSKDNGYFEIKDVPYGEYFVKAMRGSTTVGHAMNVAVRQMAVTIQDIQITPTGNIAGVADLSGTPTSGVLVFLSGTSYLAMTNDNGCFTLSDIPLGTYTLEVLIGGFYPYASSVTISQIGTTQLPETISLETYPAAEQGAVSGTVTLGGSPLPGAEVSFYYGGSFVAMELTDGAGEYLVTGLAPATYTARARDGNRVIETTVAVQGGMLATLPALDFPAVPVQGYGSVTGTVEFDGPAPSVEVKCWQNGKLIATGLSHSGTGLYTINDLAPGQYLLVAEDSEKRNAAVTVAIVADQTTTAPVLALVAPPGPEYGAINGIVDLSGSPVPNVEVDLWLGGLFMGRVQTDGSGAYYFGNLAQGTYTVMSDDETGNEGTNSAIVLVNTTTTADITLIPQIQEGTLAGRVLYRGTGGIEGVSVELWDGAMSMGSTSTDVNGDFSISNIPVGTYQLMASYPDYTGYSGMVGINQSWNMITINLAPGLDHIAFDQASYDLTVGQTLNLNNLLSAFYLDDSSGPLLFGPRTFTVLSGPAAVSSGSLSSPVGSSEIQCAYTENGLQKTAFMQTLCDYYTLIYNSYQQVIGRISELNPDPVTAGEIYYPEYLRYLPQAAEYFLINDGYLEKHSMTDDSLLGGSVSLYSYSDLAVSPAKDWVYVYDSSYNEIYPYSYDSLNEGPVGYLDQSCTGIAVTGDGSCVYAPYTFISDPTSTIVKVIDTSSMTQETEIQAGIGYSSFVRIFNTTGGEKAFVVADYSICVIDVATQTWEDTIEIDPYLCYQIGDVIASPDGSMVYVLWQNGYNYCNTVTSYSAGAYGMPLDSLNLSTDGSMDELRITPDGLYLYASCSDMIHVIETTGFTWVGDLPAPYNDQYMP
ncbi:MAG: carboxypeptidase regulatory-like domain-containing protein, partial [Candidatus Wallbacteria bacterium]|nr:carboxypeptidase regulatory-like domain-containing protein [Candidatus Wallbacteria bacterium]